MAGAFLVASARADGLPDLSNLYLESSHQIANASANGNVNVQVAFSGNQETHTTYGVVLQQLPSGAKHGFQYERVEQGPGVANAQYSSVLSPVTSPCSSYEAFATADYSLGSRGIESAVAASVSLLGGTVTTQSWGFDAARLPATGAQLGVWVNSVYSVPEDAPERVRQNPPVISIRPYQAMQFDGKDAVLITNESTNYEATTVDISGIAQMTILSKIKAETRSYVEVATGRHLWTEGTSTVVDSDLPGLIGTKTTIGEQP